MNCSLALVIFVTTALSPSPGFAQDWPALPEADGAVEVPAQEWPLRLGARTVRVKVHYPGGKLASVNKDTGIMLTLHNWGGVDCVGTASPRELADRLNVIALCVNYLQSGKESIDGPEPYDFGYFQSLDALRALYFAFNNLKSSKRPFADGRLYCTGGSGGGNVTLMANKLAPRTFACVIDLCGMNKLSDAIAYNLPGSQLNARYSRDSKNHNYLTLDDQEMRYLGNPDHLDVMKRLNPTAKVIVVHGVKDTVCPFADAQEMVFWMKRAKLDVLAYPVTQNDIDGKVFTSTGHALGDRTKIVFQVAGKHLAPAGKEALVRKGATDFERKDEIRYPTSNGAFVISYAKGYPVGLFEKAQPPIEYPDHTDVSSYRDRAGKEHPIKTVADWEIRRRHIVENVERVMGPLPGPLRRVPLDVKVVEEKMIGKLIRRKLTYQSDPDDRVPAYLFLPAEKPAGKLPAILCLHQTTKFGIDETAGVRGNANLKYGLELAERGYITLMPEYPSFNEHRFDFNAKPAYVSGSMKAIWDNIRAVDLLETLPEVDADRIGVIGHSLGGHNAMFTSLFEPRLKAIVSNCGFTTFRKDDMPSWTGPVYMPRIKTVYGNDAKKVPFDFQEIVASFAPRAFLASAAEKDDDFDVSGVRDVMAAARSIYKLHDAESRLEANYYPGPHAFPLDARTKAYEYLERHLKK
jgi:dienelactone hydrolase